MLLLEDKLTYFGINQLPPVSTLSDANINGNSKVFVTIYQKLYQYYKETLKPSSVYRFKEELDSNKIFCFDSSTIRLITDIFKEQPDRQEKRRQRLLLPWLMWLLTT